MPNLKTALLDLLFELEGSEIRLIIGGGFGLHLKAEYVRAMKSRTLFSVWPEPRSTNDLDLFMRPELIIHSGKLKPLADALAALGYVVVPGSEHYQFAKAGPGGGPGGLKIDLLTGPENSFEGTGTMVDARRARPRPSVGIQAHVVNEAPTLEEGLITQTLSGKRGNGMAVTGEVSIPSPFTYLMMKLFAFRDQRANAQKDRGRHHALDLYTILATTTDEEWKFAIALWNRYKKNPEVTEAGRIVSDLFSSLSSEGIIRLKESPYYRDEFPLKTFIQTLKELFVFDR
jgi:hypothetical protein